jgi:hypothetical protein
MLAPAAPISRLVNRFLMSNGAERGNDLEAGDRTPLKSKEEATGNQAVHLTGSDLHAPRRECVPRKIPSITTPKISDKFNRKVFVKKSCRHISILGHAASRGANWELRDSFTFLN